MRSVEALRVHGRKIGLAAAALVLVGVGVYAGGQYMEMREVQAQKELGKGMDFFHGEVASDAGEDPYAEGPTPVFRNDTAKYQAAEKEFSSVVDRYGYSKVAVVAKYYLGLTQLRLGQAKEAVQNLESVSSNSRNRTVGDLAKKVLAEHELNSGNYRRAQEILQGMLKNPKCERPKDDLLLRLSRVLAAQGKSDEAIKVLRSASSKDQHSALMPQLASELKKLEKLTAGGEDK